MGYKIAVCDDAQADRDYIRTLAARWASDRGISVQVQDFASAERFLFHYAEESDFDILLLDIEMDGMDGVTMAKRLRQDNDTLQIIFVTGYTDYIAEGYEVAALHYLVKPLKEEKLFSVLDRAAENWEAIRNYLDLLDEDLTTVDTVIKTGNAMTDAILNSKISLAKSKGIQVIADAHIPVKLRSSEIDLCCILGNLFDNAIEASLPLPEEKRLIRVYMDMKNTQLYISFTNFTARKKLVKIGSRFRSTKGQGHGFGLARMDAIVARQDGYISRNSEDGAFTTEILLPQV